ncbi:MAG: hypothetical protein JRI72_06715 [Deltaproteobacteria bacterium]|nr:hypothetical protein [Deltaproteobacteria bacterium]
MKTWSKALTFAAKGKTQDTFDSLGTITLKIGAQAVLGILAAIVPAALTDGENGAPVIRVDSSDLGISKQDFVVGPALTDGIATNDKEAPVFYEFIPFRVPSGKSLANAKIELSISGTVTTTGGWSGACSIIFADSEPPADYISDLKSHTTPRAAGGDVAYSRAGISAASLTAFSTGLSINSDAAELIGLLGFVNPNAPTAGEETVGYTEFQASQVQDFSPQEWPFVLNWLPSLGTPVGTPVPASRIGGLYFPVRFPLPRVNFTMNVSQKLAVALTNAGDGIAAVRWR